MDLRVDRPYHFTLTANFRLPLRFEILKNELDREGFSNVGLGSVDGSHRGSERSFNLIGTFRVPIGARTEPLGSAAPPAISDRRRRHSKPRGVTARSARKRTAPGAAPGTSRQVDPPIFYLRCNRVILRSIYKFIGSDSRWEENTRVKNINWQFNLREHRWKARSLRS